MDLPSGIQLGETFQFGDAWSSSVSAPPRSDLTQRSWTPFGWQPKTSRPESRDQAGCE